jgi:hypothetical protein
MSKGENDMRKEPFQTTKKVVVRGKESEGMGEDGEGGL